MTLLVAVASTVVALVRLDAATCCVQFSHAFPGQDITNINGASCAKKQIIKIIRPLQQIKRRL